MYLNKIKEISFQNKYTKWYLSICTRAQQRANSRANAKLLLGYVELHHILPKSFKMGGEKDPSNYAYLTVKEHFLCHMLLTKMFSGKFHSKMNYAMTCFYRKAPNRKLTSNQYSTAVRFYKEKFDQERSNNISKSRQKTIKHLCPHCGKTVDPGNYSQFHGDQCKSNPAIDPQLLIARSKKRRYSAKKSVENGTHRHKSPNSYGLIVCPHCNSSGINLPNMKKNHFDNCKMNPDLGKYNRSQTMRKLSCIVCHKETNSGNFVKYHGDNCRYPIFSGILPQS